MLMLFCSILILTEAEIDEFVEEIRKNLKSKLGEDTVIKLS